MRYQRDVSRIAIAKSLRRRRTSAENVLWQKLRDRALCGLKFRREHQIDCWIVDFYCPELRLIVEVDGGIHDDPDQKVYDEQRSAQLSEKGLTILRFTNEEVIRDISRVMLRLENHVEYRLMARERGR